MPGVCQLKFKLTLNSVASCEAPGAGGVSSSYRCGQAGDKKGAEGSCQLALGNLYVNLGVFRKRKGKEGKDSKKKRQEREREREIGITWAS